MSANPDVGSKTDELDEAGKARRAKMKELAETRMRSRLIREGIKRSNEELRLLKARSEGLTAELGLQRGGAGSATKKGKSA